MKSSIKVLSLALATLVAANTGYYIYSNLWWISGGYYIGMQKTKHGILKIITEYRVFNG